MSESRELLILRHAKSAWDNLKLSDFERPLNGRGKQDAPRIGAWLKAEGLAPDYVVSSPAVRARKTVGRVCRACGFDKKAVVWEPKIYAATLTDLLTILTRCPQASRRVMLVGHNPGLEELLDYLVGGIDLPEDGKLLPTASLARVELPDDWLRLSDGDATLLGLMRPAWLPAQ